MHACSAEGQLLLLQSEECLQKTLETVQVLAKPSDEGPRYYLLTGAIMQKLARQILRLRWHPCSTPAVRQFKDLYTFRTCWRQLSQGPAAAGTEAAAATEAAVTCIKT